MNKVDEQGNTLAFWVVDQNGHIVESCATWRSAYNAIQALTLFPFKTETTTVRRHYDIVPNVMGKRPCEMI